MLPDRKRAEELLSEAEGCNPGPWGNHSRITGQCAEKIARLCSGMDPEKAYIVGLLHDIGRKFGVKHLGHVYDGWKYMNELGYDEAAKICLTHSFNLHSLKDYIGRFDISKCQQEELQEALSRTEFDDYDLLIQLCDSLAGGERVVDMEERMEDIRRRYGSYPQEKWERNLELRKIFEERAGKNIYDIVCGQEDNRIEGKQIFLRPITMEDTELIVKWRNEERVRSNFVYQAPFTRERHENWMRTKVASGEVVQFIICEKNTNKPVGSVYFRDIDRLNKKAEYGIFIGEADFAGRGIGSETAKLAVSYAKDVLKLHKLMLRVFADNAGAVKSYRNAGFEQEAYLKDEIFQNGSYRDMLLMAVIFAEN